METIQSIHIMRFIILIVVLYTIWAVWYLHRLKKRSHRDIPLQEKKCKGDVVGKSLFVLPRSHSLPEASTASDNEKVTENSDIFAASDVPGYPRQIPPEELDEVFGAVPKGETNEPLDIDYPFESDFPDEEADDIEGDDDFDEESEDLLLQSKSRASGISFEEMGEAYRHVVHNPQLTDEQKEDTGRILLNLKHTDMFEAIVSGQPMGEDKVNELIDTFLSAFYQRMSEKNGESQALRSTVPEDFDVSDYA